MQLLKQNAIEAEEKVQPIYKLDLTIQIELAKKVDLFFNQINEIRNNEEYIMEQKIQYLENSSVIGLDKGSYEVLLKSNEQDLSQLQENIKYLIDQILNQRINEEQLESKREEIKEFFQNSLRKTSLTI